jgi:pimeloyl-ACP methyl ester carboxylesterase
VRDHEAVTSGVERFDVAVPEAELDDLRRRLEGARWPERETGPAQGIGLDRLRGLCERWAQTYDWRRLEGRLNAVEQGRFLVDGLRIHFLHGRSSEHDAVPLLLTHGWPGSVVEHLDVVEPLTRAGFHCVVPSLPGYGWSDKPAGTGWTVQRTADAWAALMAGLGYDRYLAQGSDWGTSVTACLGRQDREHVMGIHVMPPLVPAAQVRSDTGEESGYSTLQRTRPQTVGYALTDSPVALAGWVGEKLLAWTDPREPLSDEQVLDGLSVYWFTRTGASAARLYWESLGDVDRWLGGPLEAHDLVDAPAGCSVFPYELQRPTRGEAEARFRNIRYWGTPERGGHFAAWEQPALFVEEIAAFRAAL